MSSSIVRCRDLWSGIRRERKDILVPTGEASRGWAALSAPGDTRLSPRWYPTILPAPSVRLLGWLSMTMEQSLNALSGRHCYSPQPSWGRVWRVWWRVMSYRLPSNTTPHSPGSSPGCHLVEEGVSKARKRWIDHGLGRYNWKGSHQWPSEKSNCQRHNLNLGDP